MSNVELWRKGSYRDDAGFRELQRVANQMFNNFFREWDVLDRNDILLPIRDFYEANDSYHLSMELPGILKDDIDVSISGDTPKIKGEEKYGKESSDKSKGKYYCLERSYGSFYRSVSLPADADRDNIAVNFTNGILEIVIKKSAQSSVKKISIS